VTPDSFPELLKRRRMVRNYLPDPIDHETIERIVGTVRRAPSAGFSQGHRLVVVTEPETRRQLARLKEYAKHMMSDQRWRDRLSRVEVELTVLEITNLRFLDRMRRSGQPPGADVSMLKIKGTEIQQGLTELMMDATDPAASDALSEAVRKRYLSMRKTTIYAGSNEIQRNIIAKMTLGL